MTADNLIIFQKTYNFIKEIYPVINNFPKSHRQVLGKYIEEICIQLLIQIIKANKLRDIQRLRLQDNISDQLDSLRILIRLSKDLKFISIKGYLKLEEKLNEISKMIYGWSKT